ncbi:hypothetical protein CABS03_15260 [Colletotrichum abscissum]
MASDPEGQQQSPEMVETRAAARRREEAGTAQTPTNSSGSESTGLLQPTRGSDISPSRSNTPATANTGTSQSTTPSESGQGRRGRNPIPDGIPIPHKWVNINPDYWGTWMYRIADQPNGEQIDAALIYLTEVYERKGLQGQPLFYEIADDLSHWPDGWFASASPGIAKAVNGFLHGRGVLPAQLRSREPHEILAATIAEEEFVPWSQAQVDRAYNRFDEFRKRVNDPDFLPTITNGNLSSQKDIQRQNMVPEVRQSTIPPISIHSSSPLPMRNSAPIGQQERRQTTRSHQQYAATQGSHTDTENMAATTRQFTDLKKIFPREKLYSGGKYEVLQETLTMFYDYCEKVGIREHQYHSVINVVLAGKASDYYYEAVRNLDRNDFLGIIDAIRSRFETHDRNLELLSELRAISFASVARTMEGKSRVEILEELIDRIDKLAKTQPNEGTNERKVGYLCTAVQRVPEAKITLHQAPEDYETLCSRLRSSFNIEARMPRQTHLQAYDGPHQQHWVDRTYNGKGKETRYGNRQQGGPDSSNGQRFNSRAGQRKKQCFICKKDGCWSSNHSEEERAKSYEQYRKSRAADGKTSPHRFNQFLVIYEGRSGGTEPSEGNQIGGLKHPPPMGNTEDEEDLTPYTDELDYDEIDDINHSFFAPSASGGYTRLNEQKAVEALNEQAFIHGWQGKVPQTTDTEVAERTNPTAQNSILLTPEEKLVPLLTSEEKKHGAEQFQGQPEGSFLYHPDHSNAELVQAFHASERYGPDNFHGIIPDTGASQWSTGGKGQFQALQKIAPVTLNTSTAGIARISFGPGEEIVALGTVEVETHFGTMNFHILPVNTPFLLCLKDMDRLGIIFDNTRNRISSGKHFETVERRWGHAFMRLSNDTKSINYLTENELRRLHRRFSHPSVARLYNLLKQSGNDDVEIGALEQLTKVCHQCQMNAQSPRRFKFKLRDELNFNWEIVVDIFYLNSRPVIHIIDEATSFQAGQFLRDLQAKTVWAALRKSWIDTYQGPPDGIRTDAGTSFKSAEFKENATAYGIQLKVVPVEAHHSIGKVERAHQQLKRAFRIIKEENPDSDDDECLQTALKCCNDTMGHNGLIPTLLVFGAYPRTTSASPPSPDVSQRARAVEKAMRALREVSARRQVNEAIAARNGPDIGANLDMPLNSDVRVWREITQQWAGPYKLISVDGRSCVVARDRDQPLEVSITAVRPYHMDPIEVISNPQEEEEPEETVQPAAEAQEIILDEIVVAVPTDDEEEEIAERAPVPPARRRGRPRRQAPTRQFITSDEVINTFYTAKEKADFELAVKLRKEGVITTAGKPYEGSDLIEADTLRDRGVYRFILYDPEKHANLRIFKSRMVREIKGKGTPQPYEKSRHVIQGYGDVEKATLLTQSPTVQRCSQRLMMALMASLRKKGYEIWSRDITQAYTQSATGLTRKILAYLPKEMASKYPKGTIIEVLKPLYGLAESGTHWWATYHDFHINQLSMVTSTYDPRLLVSEHEGDQFGIVGMQTDDTLGLSDVNFMNKEDEELQKAGFAAKPKEVLTTNTPLTFNGGILTIEGETVVFRQKGQGEKITLVDPHAIDAKKRYKAELARGAYIASICQPEATFDCARAAQATEPSERDVEALNKRLKWQQSNLDRGLVYYPVDLATSKLYVFVDGSFANNDDLTSQLGYIIILANESMGESEFTIHGNVIHYSSTKSKRVTRSVLASEVYGMVNGVDLAHAISTTLRRITNRLNLPSIPTVVCTDSYSLYECLVKLGTTKEKRLMIDIMALRQSYERREILEIRWINGDDNLADAFTKAAPNKGLEQFVGSEKVNASRATMSDSKAAVAMMAR